MLPPLLHFRGIRKQQGANDDQRDYAWRRRANVTTIGKKAFYGCSKLTAVTIGKNVTSIGASAFENCKKLKTITIKSSKLKTVGKKAFRKIHSKAVIKVPKKKLKPYKKLLKNKGQGKNVVIKY